MVYLCAVRNIGHTLLLIGTLGQVPCGQLPLNSARTGR